MDVTTIGLDIAKNVFPVHGVDGTGKVVIRRQLRRRAFRKKQDDAIAADVAANYLGGAEAARASIQSNNKGGPVETGHREFAGTRLAVQAATLDLPPAKRYPALREGEIWLPGERDGATTTRD